MPKSDDCIRCACAENCFGREIILGFFFFFFFNSAARVAYKNVLRRK